MTYQSFQECSAQKAIPVIPNDGEHLEIVQENLLDALNYLQFCHHYLESSGLSKKYSQLFTAVADSLNACNEAIEHVTDQPDV